MGSRRPADRPIRVIVQHFALPRYRVPVFEALAQTPGISLEVMYGTAPGLANAPAEGFAAKPSPVRRVRLPLGYVMWDRSQWASAGRGRADVLILTWNVRSLSLLPALLRAKLGGTRTLLWGHGYSRRDTGWRLLLRRLAARLADGLIFYGHRDAERFIAETGRAEATFVAVNSLDQGPIRREREAWLSDPGALERFRARNDLAGRPTVLFVSRHKPENRVDLLVEAAARLRPRYPRLTVVFVGDGMVQNAELRDQVRRLALEDVVRFLGPVYDEHHLAPWFLSADVFCYPSNLGLSVLHAFGYGVPVVTGDREDANPPEWQAVRHGVNGLHFRHGDVTSLADGLGALLGDAALRDRLGRNAAQTVEEVYTLDEMVRGLREAIGWAAGE